MILKRGFDLYKNNKGLLSFMALSYLDKAIIFLLPLLVFQLFKDQKVYVSIEYIYSITTVVVPLIDLGLSGYFYYAYRNTKHPKSTIRTFLDCFQVIFLLISFIGVGLICIDYLVLEIDEFIVFIVARLLFVLVSVFYTSYFRLIGKPKKAVYITLSSNFLSLLFVLGHFFSESDFSLWLIFIGQILFSIGYIFKCINDVIFNNHRINKNKVKSLIVDSLLFSWPSIFQVFIMMYVANYGKLNAIRLMSIEDGALLSLIQRFSMLIQLTHTAVLAFLIKDIYTTGKLLEIKLNILRKYVFLLLLSVVGVFIIIISYFFYTDLQYSFSRFITILSIIIAYMFFWCIASYFEVYYSRENKNRIKLFLAILNGVCFMTVLNVLDMEYLEKIAIGMFLSTLLTFIISILILKKRRYYLI